MDSIVTSIPAESISANSCSIFETSEAAALPIFVPLEEVGQVHPYKLNPPKPYIAADGETVHTVDSLTYLCLMMDAKKAVQQGDLSYCVTPLISKMYHGGEVISLNLVQGKWAADETRVSSDHQRSGLTRTTTKRSEAKNQKDTGHSEEEQIRRAIWFFLTNRYAFKIYNDSGLTGEFPHNRPALIKELSEKKADRYERIYRKVVLDDVSIQRRTPEQVKTLQDYMKRRVELIRQGSLSVDDLNSPSLTVQEENNKVLRRGRPRTALSFRPGFTQLWDDTENGYVFLVTATDRSRIVRDADLEMAFLKMCSRYHVKIKGLVDNLDSMDVSDPLKQGMTYLMGKFYESQLEEITTRTFRGHVQNAESGGSYQRLPWWLTRDSSGKIQLIPEYVAVVHRIIDLYLCGFGMESITRKIAEEGVRVKGKYLSTSTVSKTIRRTERLEGRWKILGLERDILPAVIEDPETIAALRAVNQTSLQRHQKLTDGVKWENHLFAGLTRCSCGSHAKWKYQVHSGTRSGQYYGCGKVHRRLDRHPHGVILEHVLIDFFDDLLGKNHKFLIGHIARTLGGSTHFERVRRREEIERDLAEAERAYADKSEAVRIEVCEALKGMGLREDSPTFPISVNALISSKTEDEMEAVQSLRASLAMIGTADDKANLATSIMRPLEEMQDWHGMTLLQKNRLLRSVFEKIVIFPRHEGRKIEIYLNGIEQPLPTLWLRYVLGQKWRLPTVAEWVDDMITPPTNEVLQDWFRLSKATPFYIYLKRSGKLESPTCSKLVTALHEGYKGSRKGDGKYRPLSKVYLTRMLTQIGADNETFEQFEAEWSLYMDREYALYQKAKQGSDLESPEPEGHLTATG